MFAMSHGIDRTGGSSVDRWRYELVRMHARRFRSARRRQSAPTLAARRAETRHIIRSAQRVVGDPRSRHID